MKRRSTKAAGRNEEVQLLLKIPGLTLASGMKPAKPRRKKAKGSWPPDALTLPSLEELERLSQPEGDKLGSSPGGCREPFLRHLAHIDETPTPET